MISLRPYVIEGLDCSGKKTIAKIVRERLTRDGIECEIVIGPLYGGFLRKADDWLVGLSYKKAFRPLYAVRKLIYVLEPVLDGCFFRPEQNKMIVKVSAHYRAWARAIVENDKGMIRGFERGKKFHYKYMGVSLITTEFQNRVDRHRSDKEKGKTYKNESQRFFGNNKDLFARWNSELEKLLFANVGSVNVVFNNGDVESAANLVYEHIKGCLCEERDYHDQA